MCAGGCPPAGGRRTTSSTPERTLPWTPWTATPTLPTTRPGWCPTRQRRPPRLLSSPPGSGCATPRPRCPRRSTTPPAAPAGPAAVPPPPSTRPPARRSPPPAMNSPVATDTSRATPSHLPLHQVRPDARLLDEERQLLTHAIGDGRLQ